MKKLFLIILCVPILCIAQDHGYVNGVRLDSISSQYAQIGLTTGKAIGTMAAGILMDIKLTFDYGQKWKKESEVRITDDKGETLVFNSTAGALNFLYKNGWEFIYKSPDTYQFLLRKIPKP